VELDVNDLKDVVQDLSWDDLVLPKGHKELVQALVQTHTAGLASQKGSEAQRFEVDLVRGKGSGCIILLHGEPGVGKTSTAECVAAFTKRPLYPITCGDIGTTPSEVEENLERHFNLAHKWGCVLLLDEADIFLARRSKAGDDISRNGLVSVFLRILEYYSGILFLTTNRVGTFDGAFRSRIHLMLYYPKLTEKQALQIFDNNLNRIEEYNATRRSQGKPEVEISDKEIHKWAKKRLTSSDKSLRIYWNGRQIRNAFQTALALAEFEAQQQQGKQAAKAGTADDSVEPAPPKVTKEHFKRIAKAIAHFDNYLTQVHFGQDEDSIARRNEERGDNPPKPKQRKSDKKDESDTSDDESEVSSASSLDDKSSDSDDDESDKGKSKRKKKGKSKK
jgi:SpoVK/Ycf46/Vps4 family AAA+-type ATPase